MPARAPFAAVRVRRSVRNRRNRCVLPESAASCAQPMRPVRIRCASPDPHPKKFPPRSGPSRRQAGSARGGAFPSPPGLVDLDLRRASPRATAPRFLVTADRGAAPLRDGCRRSGRHPVPEVSLAVPAAAFLSPRSSSLPAQPAPAFQACRRSPTATPSGLRPSASGSTGSIMHTRWRSWKAASVEDVLGRRRRRERADGQAGVGGGVPVCMDNALRFGGGGLQSISRLDRSHAAA